MTGGTAGGRRLGYEPSLDGLRALAVGAVLLFHGGVGGTTGGFLGVSVFFTLSGFLITLLLLRERDDTGTIGLRSFWGRRVRRLSPAAMTCVAVVLATATRWLDPVQLRNLPGDSIAALANVANWRYVVDDQSYADLFAAGPSPLVHFWSLAIEEQFYLVFPVLMVALLAVRTQRWVAPAVLAALASASVAATLATHDHDLVYYGTHTRAAEFLIGALLAFVVAGGQLERLGHRGRIAASMTGWVAVVAFVVLVTTVHQSSAWLYRGGFAALALLWASMIVAALLPGSFRRMAGLAALAWIGRMSYGLYLIHWPVFLALDADRVGVDGPGLFVVRIVVSVALTVVVYHVLEQPIRRRRLLPTMPSASMAYGLALAGLIGASILVVHPNGPSSVAADVPDAVVAFSQQRSTAAVNDGIGPPAAPSPAAQADGSALPAVAASAAPIRVLVVGSEASVAARLERASNGALEIIDAVHPGCPLSITDAEIADPTGPWNTCGRPADVVDLVRDTHDVRVVVVAIGTAERERLERLGGESAVNHDDAVRTEYFAGVSAVADALATLDEQGHRLVFLDVVPDADLVSQLVDVAAIRAHGSSVGDYSASDDQLVGTIVAAARPIDAQRTRVLVIGDSTSYAIAVALDTVASDRYDVVWAGQSNCPLSPAFETRWWDDVTARVVDCPSAERTWPEVVDSFRPDVVFAVASLPELAEQRYGPDDVWHRPGDAAYLEHHDAGGAALAALAARSGAVLLLADAPTFGPGGFEGGPLGRPERLAAWNSVLNGWADRWSMMRVVPYAELLGQTEFAAGGPLRPDGAHLTPEGAESLVRDRLLPALPGWIADARATMIEVAATD